MTNRERIVKIIVVAGSGRSGSTLLSVLLSQQRRSFNLGQLRDFPSAFLKDEHCTCGARLQSCPVWQKVVVTAFGDQYAAELQRLHFGMAAFSSAAKRLPDWRGEPIDRLRRSHREDLSRLAALVGAAASVTKASFLIDASKSPEIALALSLSNGTDVWVLNLVRDPRAVAVSWSKKVGFETALQRSKAWLHRQAILARWSKEIGRQFALLRYEDFTAHPKVTLEELLNWVGEELVDEVFTSDSSARLSWRMQHLYPPANESFIAEKSESVEICEANAWRDPRNIELFRAVNNIVRPGLSHYGYAEAPLLASGSKTELDNSPAKQSIQSAKTSPCGVGN